MAKSQISGITSRTRKEMAKQKKLAKELEKREATAKARKDLDAAKKKTAELSKKVAAKK